MEKVLLAPFWVLKANINTPATGEKFFSAFYLGLCLSVWLLPYIIFWPFSWPTRRYLALWLVGLPRPRRRSQGGDSKGRRKDYLL